MKWWGLVSCIALAGCVSERGRRLVPDTVMVDERGGTAIFNGGIEVIIPPGALTEPTPIGVAALRCGLVEDAIQPRGPSTSPASCLGAVRAEPSGTEFEVPIQIRLPIEPPPSNSLPAVEQAFLDEGRSAIITTEMNYDALTGIATFTVPHFSDFVLTARERRIRALLSACRTCRSIGNPDCDEVEQIPAQDSCCLVRRSDRLGCAPDCNCCQEGRLRITSAALDLTTATECQVVSNTISVEFLDCEPRRTITESVAELSRDCPEGATLQLNVTPSETDLCIYEEATLEPTFDLLDRDGMSTASGNALPVWQVMDPSMAVDFWDTRETRGDDPILVLNVKAKSATPAVVQVEAGATTPGSRSGMATINILDALEDPACLDLNGRWIVQTVSGSETCTVEGEEPMTRTLEDDDFAVDITQTRPMVRIRAEDFPMAAMLEGPVTLGDEMNPYMGTVTVNANNTVDCLLFNRSDGREFAFGEELCIEGETCSATSCSESETITFRSDPTQNTLDATSDWDFNATVTVMGDPPISRTVRCEGESELRLERFMRR